MEAFCKQNPPDNPYWCNIIWGYCQFQIEPMINEHCPIYQMGKGGSPVIIDDVTDEVMQKLGYATIYNKQNRLVSLGDTAFFGSNDEILLKLPYLRYIGKYAFQDCVNLVELDFSGKTDDDIPVLASPSAFMISGTMQFVNDTFVIKVPSRLYEKWTSAVNWNAVKNHIVGV